MPLYVFTQKALVLGVNMNYWSRPDSPFKDNENIMVLMVIQA